ncbi:MAG TPA: T9SS type A sorting domain-containing protein [Bacteroidales bacterium]|nr:T9SS type A sorting domain-containing protein [Bacteroidales bacterium]HPS15925.1 T9SS type A sorting domain-containing protein [Bacteroidales bacterium]
MFPYSFLSFIRSTSKNDLARLAQRYDGVANSTVSDVIVQLAVLKGTTQSTTASIYSVGTDNKPGILLGTSTAKLKSTLTTGFVNTNVYHFTTPIATTSKFFVTLDLPLSFTYNTDELSVMTINNKCSGKSGDSLGWFQYNSSTWYSYDWFVGANLDMAIFPVICAQTAVGINENIVNDHNVMMYPNPTNSLFTVDFSAYQNTEATIEVYNMIGKLVKTIKSEGTTDRVNIDMSNEETGVYIINIKTPAGNVIKKLSLIK